MQLLRRHPALLVWAGTAAAIAIAAAAFGYDPFDSATWARWDSMHYEAIARQGYDLEHCSGTYTPADWCGNAGWFPAYPWLVGTLHRIGLPLRGTAVVVSWVFAAATLVLLWWTFLRRDAGVAALGALVYAAWAPGQIYHYAVFPLSMLAFFTVAHLWLAQRGHYAGAGLTGAVAVLTYPLGLVLVPVTTLSGPPVDRSVGVAERLRRSAWAGASPCSAHRLSLSIKSSRPATGTRTSSSRRSTGTTCRTRSPRRVTHSNRSSTVFPSTSRTHPRSRRPSSPQPWPPCS